MNKTNTKNKFEFIHSKKIRPNLIEITTLENRKPELVLNTNNWTGEEEGYLFCPNSECSFKIPKKNCPDLKQCTSCNALVEWNLKQKWEEQEQIKKDFNILRIIFRAITFDIPSITLPQDL